jgi:hypothetical protein
MKIEIVETNGEARVRDLVLAERLGYEDPRMLRRLVERHWERLSAFGDISVTVTENSDPLGRGRPGRSYWLNRKQTLYLCAKSETPRAAEVTIAMVEVFDAWLEGKTVPVREHMRRPPAGGQVWPGALWPGEAPKGRTDLRPFSYCETPLPYGLTHVSALVQNDFAAQMHAVWMRQILIKADRWPRPELLANHGSLSR